MRVLCVSSLYPNSAQPGFGIFVENRLRALCARYPVQARVAAPVPFYPSWLPGSARYRAYSRVAPEESRHGISVLHPRWFTLPKLGSYTAPFAMMHALLKAARSLQRDGFDFDIIDAHYLYPDGVAAVMLARRLGKPALITARGSDLNVIARSSWPRRLIRTACNRADAVITVSSALGERVRGIGARPQRLLRLINGVDLERFSPRDREQRRRRLGFEGPVALAMGNLVPIKGHDLVIAALARVPELRLVIVGDGPSRAGLEGLAARVGVSERVRFVGRVDPSEAPDYLCAADVLVMGSHHEGMPNVVLEALACGTPVVSPPVGGVPELLKVPEAGCLLSARDTRQCADALERLLASPPSRSRTREFAEAFGWDETSRGQWRVMNEVLDARVERSAGAARRDVDSQSPSRHA